MTKEAKMKEAKIKEPKTKKPMTKEAKAEALKTNVESKTKANKPKIRVNDHEVQEAHDKVDYRVHGQNEQGVRG